VSIGGVLRRFRDCSGQAAVELLAALPLAAVVLLCAWQLIVTGQAWWTASEVARVAARTLAVQTTASDRDAAATSARRVAMRLLPVEMRRGSRLDALAAGRVRLRVRAPLVAPFSAVFRRGPAITARAEFLR
jgi:hypothetical protein